MPDPSPVPDRVCSTRVRDYLEYVEGLAACDETYGATHAETLTRIAHAIALSRTVTDWQRKTVRAIVSGAPR